MKLSDYVIEFIAELGVRHIFMLPGGGAMHLNDSLGKSSKVKFICNLHEQASAVAAEAYAQYTGLGVAMVTTGPGGTNAITGVAGAWLESSPLIMISGQVKRSDLVGERGVRQIGFQEIDIVGIVRPITKFAVTITDPVLIKATLEEAVWHATSGRRGPVWVDIPLDVQASEIDPSKLVSFDQPPAPDSSAHVNAAVEKTLQLLAQAKRPIILVGNGVRSSGAIGIFLNWAERVGLPILTTWKALDFIEDDHCLFVGRPGAVGQRAANFAQQTSDLFISIGARLDFGQTAYDHRNFAPRARRIVVDIDPFEIAKLQMDLAVGLSADAGCFLNELNAKSESITFPNWSSWLEQCRSWKEKYPPVGSVAVDLSAGVDNYLLVEKIGLAMRSGDLLVPGSSGACSEITCQALPVKKGIRFINTQGLGSMGFGVPAALGACLAANKSRTICIDGDGGFVMNSQELSLIAALALPIKFFVLNNGGYNSIRTTQVNYFNSRFVACDSKSGLEIPKLEKISQAAGVKYHRIENNISLVHEIDRVFSENGPIICEVIMAAGQFTRPKVHSKQAEDGRMVTMPMEDLWPFLPRDLFAAEMSVVDSD